MYALLGGLLILVADLGSKTAAQLGIIRADWIVPARNPALALGIAEPAMPVIVTAAVCALLSAALLVYRRRRGLAGEIAAAAVLGGGLGNLVDRITIGYVRDFVAVPFIVFNVADVALLLGIAAYLIDRRRRAQRSLEM